MNISRQHSETEIVELNGLECKELLGVGEAFDKGMSLFFISTLDFTYKFYIDEGVLFWEEGFQYSEEDLDEDEQYIDILSSLGLENTKIKNISMKDNNLSINIER